MRVFRRVIAAILLVCLLSVPILAAYNGDTIVYVTRTGEKYHSYGCQYLHSSCIPITLENAVLRYTPCSRCYPPRLTGNSSGNSGYTGGTGGGGQSYTPSATPTPTPTPTQSIQERIDALKNSGAPVATTTPAPTPSNNNADPDTAESGGLFPTALGTITATGIGVVGTLIVMSALKRRKNNSYTPPVRYEPVQRPAENTEQVSPPPQTPQWEDIEPFVCFTHSGNTYHRPSCRYAKGIKAPLSQVGNRRPCKVCRPPEKKSYTR